MEYHWTELNAEDEPPFDPPPYTFKLVLVLGVLYLGWRLVQFIQFLFKYFS